MKCHQFAPTATRRDLLRTSAAGFGQLALAAMAGTQASADTQSAFAPLPHTPARAKRVIFLFMWGGPSHVDMFDPKPRLNSEDGKELAGTSVGSKKENLGKLLGSPFKFSQHDLCRRCKKTTPLATAAS